MRLRQIVAVATVFLGWAFAQGGAKPSTGKVVYFLRDEAHGQWCGYASESRMKAQIRPLTAMILGRVLYENGRVSTVEVSEADQTGDWEINDEYALDQSGKVRTLKRTVNIIPEDSSEEQLFVVVKGKLVKQRTIYRELSTDKPSQAQRSVDWFRPPPPITSLSAFPFSALIAGKQQAVWSNGVLCVEDGRK